MGDGGREEDRQLGRDVICVSCANQMTSLLVSL